MLYSTLIWVLYFLSQQFFKSWNQLHCSLQAFGYYFQRLPGLTTKSTHYYLHSYYFSTRFTFIALRILPLTLSFDIVPLDPLMPKLTTRLSAGAQIPMTQRHACIDYIIKCCIQAVTSIKFFKAKELLVGFFWVHLSVLWWWFVKTPDGFYLITLCWISSVVWHMLSQHISGHVTVCDPSAIDLFMPWQVSGCFGTSQL